MSSWHRLFSKRNLALLVTAVTVSSLILSAVITQKNTTASLPPMGTDTFPSSAALILEMHGESHVLHVMGPTTVMRGDPMMGHDGLYMIETEIVMMELTGVMPPGELMITEHPTMKSMGHINQRVDRFFDVFFDVFVQVMVKPRDSTENNSDMICLENHEPFMVQVEKVPGILPLGIPLTSPSMPIPLHLCGDDKGETFGSLTLLYHLPGTNEDLKVEIKKEIRALKERVSETVELGGTLIKPGELIVLLDTTASGSLSVVHVAATLPCHPGPVAGPINDTPNVKIIAGVAGGLVGDVIESPLPDDTGFLGPHGTCVFHDTFIPSIAVPVVTDVILVNPGPNNVKLPPGALVTITGTYV
jgi:hypothetical protein